MTTLEAADAAWRATVKLPTGTEGVLDLSIRKADFIRGYEAAAEAAEARYDCHGGPGTTIPACGACLTCVMREREEFKQTAADVAAVLKSEQERLTTMVDQLLEHAGKCECEGGECSRCGEIVCPHRDPMHFHHDGCPSCYAADHKEDQ